MPIPTERGNEMCQCGEFGPQYVIAKFAMYEDGEQYVTGRHQGVWREGDFDEYIAWAAAEAIAQYAMLNEVPVGTPMEARLVSWKSRNNTLRNPAPPTWE